MWSHQHIEDCISWNEPNKSHLMSYTRISAKKKYGLEVCAREKVRLATSGDLKLSNFAEVMFKKTIQIVIYGMFFLALINYDLTHQKKSRVPRALTKDHYERLIMYLE